MVNRLANVRPVLPTSRSNQEARGSMSILRLPLSAVHSPIAPFSPLRELRCARRDSCIPQEVFSPLHYWRLLNSSGPTRWASYTRHREASSIWRDAATVKQFFMLFMIPSKTSKKRGFGPIVAPAFVTVLNETLRTEIIVHLRNLLLRQLHRRQLTVELLHQFQIERLAPDSVKVNVSIGPSSVGRLRAGALIIGCSFCDP